MIALGVLCMHVVVNGAILIETIEFGDKSWDMAGYLRARRAT